LLPLVARRATPEVQGEHDDGIRRKIVRVQQSVPNFRRLAIDRHVEGNGSSGPASRGAFARNAGGLELHRQAPA
jgi:hypothetical protein